MAKPLDVKMAESVRFPNLPDEKQFCPTETNLPKININLPEKK